MAKEWSTLEVAQAHGYLNIIADDSPHHNIFSHWLKNQTLFPKTVVDIGCCSGRVLDSIGGIADKYLGIDFSEASIQFAEMNRATPSYNFVCMDAETDDLPFHPTDYSICYIDSVITMVQSPTRLLFKLAPYFDCIFLNRTSISAETNKGSMLWSGMDTESVLWSFSLDYFRAMANETGFGFVNVTGDQKVVIMARKG